MDNVSESIHSLSDIACKQMTEECDIYAMMYAIEKQIPQKPKRDSRYIPYCECGQKLDWSKKMTDNIFLLSTEEYEKYKERIPQINCWWWLRSPGHDSDFTAVVNYDVSAYDYGNIVYSHSGVVRPALRLYESEKHEIGERVVVYDFPWIIIDKDLAIAEVPIAFRRFDKKSNDYEKSEIRQFLLDWLKDRQ